MILQKLQFTVASENDGVRLDDFVWHALSQHFEKQVLRSRVRHLVLTGSIYVNRKRTRVPAQALKSGSLVHVFVAPEKLLENIHQRLENTLQVEDKDVLFEDEWILCVNKWAPIPTQPTLDPNRPNLFALVRAFLTRRDRDGDPYVGLHHRLDRDTTGVMLFTKRKEANAGIARQFVEHEIRKTYLAIVAKGEEPQKGDAFRVQNHLGPDPRSLKIKKFRSVRSGGDYAETEFACLDASESTALIEAKPKTGRTHQIRVHLSEAGCPILGDPVYADEFVAKRASRALLHALRLEFLHPISNEAIAVDAPVPEDFKETLSVNGLSLRTP